MFNFELHIVQNANVSNGILLCQILSDHQILTKSKFYDVRNSISQLKDLIDQVRKVELNPKPNVALYPKATSFNLNF